MAEVKTPKMVAAELLSLSPADRQARVAVDGNEEVAMAYINTALANNDGAMLKYLIELVDTPSERLEPEELSKEDRMKRWLKNTDGAIGG